MSIRADAVAGLLLVLALAVSACGALKTQTVAPQPAPMTAPATSTETGQPSSEPAESVHAEHMRQKPGANPPAPDPELR